MQLFGCFFVFRSFLYLRNTTSYMKKKFWTTDKLVGLVAIMISFITLVIFVKQTNIIEKQSHLSVMPYLMISISEVGSENKYSLKLINYGVGPAIIDSTTIFYKGKTYNEEFADFLQSEIKIMDSVPVLNHATLGRGLAIPSGGERNILTAGGTEKSFRNFLEVMETLDDNDFHFEIYYRSIYDHRWRITSSSDLPEELEK